MLIIDIIMGVMAVLVILFVELEIFPELTTILTILTSIICIYAFVVSLASGASFEEAAQHLYIIGVVLPFWLSSLR